MFLLTHLLLLLFHLLLFLCFSSHSIASSNTLHSTHHSSFVSLIRSLIQHVVLDFRMHPLPPTSDKKKSNIIAEISAIFRISKMAEMILATVIGWEEFRQKIEKIVKISTIYWFLANKSMKNWSVERCAHQARVSCKKSMIFCQFF